jgi:hypothetical protein
MNMKLAIGKRWIMFFAILQIFGIIFATAQTSYIIYEVRKARRKILEGDYF